MWKEDPLKINIMIIKSIESIARIHPFSENMDNYEIHLFASYSQHFLTIYYLILNTGRTTVVIFLKAKNEIL